MNWLDFGFHRSKYDVITWTNMGKNSVLAPQLHSNIPDRSFCQSIRLIGTVLSISEKFDLNRSRPPHYQIWEKCSLKAMVETWPNMVQNTVMGIVTEFDAHYKGGFWRPMCNLGIHLQVEASHRHFSVKFFPVVNIQRWAAVQWGNPQGTIQSSL